MRLCIIALCLITILQGERIGCCEDQCRWCWDNCEWTRAGQEGCWEDLEGAQRWCCCCHSTLASLEMPIGFRNMNMLQGIEFFKFWLLMLSDIQISIPNYIVVPMIYAILGLHMFGFKYCFVSVNELSLFRLASLEMPVAFRYEYVAWNWVFQVLHFWLLNAIRISITKYIVVLMRYMQFLVFTAFHKRMLL